MPASMETVNDLHGELINLARAIQITDSAALVYESVQRTLLHETLMRECAERVRSRDGAPAGDAPDVQRAIDYFVCSWMGKGGVAGSKSYRMGVCARYTKNGGHGARRFVSAVESIPDWHERLRPVTILSRDGIELCEKIEDGAGVVLYADPPYLAKGAEYLHDFDWLAHRSLAKALRRFQKTRVVVSYYDHPDLAQMYPGWTVVPCTMTRAMASQGQRGERGRIAVAPEVLLINGPSYAEAA
jgi:DNA adenine methylase